MSDHKRENLWVNLILNVLLPSLLLARGGKWLNLEPAPVLILALSMPLLYGIYDFIRRRKTNLFSVIGFVSVLITGAVGLFEDIPVRWIAIKEAAVPLLFAIAIYITSFTQKPLIRSLLFSKELFDVDLIEQSLEERNTVSDFEQIISSCTVWVVGSFLLSAVLNYALAVYLVQRPSTFPGFDYNAAMAKMLALSWPVIALPTTLVMMVALMKLMKGIEKTTGHPLDDVLHPEVREKIAAKDAALEEKRAAKAANKD